MACSLVRCRPAGLASVFIHTCMAESVEYFCHGVQVSPDHSRLAYAVDTVGGEKFTLHVLDLATGQELLTPTIEVSAMAVQTSSPPVLAVSTLCTRLQC